MVFGGLDSDAGMLAMAIAKPGRLSTDAALNPDPL
jgi:hypothetical protein